MKSALFFRLLSHDDKAAALAEAVAALREGHTLNPVTYAVDPDSLRQVPGSSFAYWVSEHIRRLFTDLSRLESEGRDAQSGASTMNDFRFLRAWWEVDAQTLARERTQTLNGGRWVPLAKGGAYSPFYCDWELVIEWENDGEVLKREVAEYRGRRGWGYQWSAALNGYAFYFRPGLTWPRRTQLGLNVRVLPTGCIIGDKGPSVFVAKDEANELWVLLGLMNSEIFRALVHLQMAFGSFEVGVMERTPIPKLLEPKCKELASLARKCVYIKHSLETANEISHIFHLSAVLQVGADSVRRAHDKLVSAQFEEGLSQGSPLQTCFTSWQVRVAEAERQLAEYQRQIDDIAFHLYGIEGKDRQAIEERGRGQELGVIEEENDTDGVKETEEEQPTSDHQPLTTDLLSYAIGSIFGRWDMHFATGEQPAPELPDPFAPLPVCSPGMLTGDNGLPLREAPPNYPLGIDWDGILVDDPDHPDDIIRRVREVLDVLWGERAEAIEQEVCEILGIKELRDYFRKPGNGGFWLDHVRRYSKSRRKAPIYWLLQSSKKNYALWLYYHRLDKDILFKALINYMEPKLRLEENRLEQLRTQRTAAGTSGREAKQLEKQLDRQEGLLSELRDFHDKLRRAADLHLEPDLNDGVVLNIAPLWELVPWNEARKYWEELLAGKYEWSSVGKQLRDKGMVK